MIDIKAEVKYSFVTQGEYLVCLRDADQTIIGKLLQAEGGWKSYSIAPDGGWKGNFVVFGQNRDEASRPLLQAYEVSVGLRDVSGRRVQKDLETNLWYVAAAHTGVRESKRWADKADAIAHLASLQVPAYAVVTVHAVTNEVNEVHTKVFADADAATAYGQSINPDIDGSMLPNVPKEVLDAFGGDQSEEYFRGLFWLRVNRYAVIFQVKRSNYAEIIETTTEVEAEPAAEEKPDVEITPVMVWVDGTVSTGVEELKNHLNRIAYGTEDEQPKLYLTQDGGLVECRTRRMWTHSSGDSDWLYETHGVFPLTATDFHVALLKIELTIDGRA